MKIFISNNWLWIVASLSSLFLILKPALANFHPANIFVQIVILSSETGEAVAEKLLSLM